MCVCVRERERERERRGREGERGMREGWLSGSEGEGGDSTGLVGLNVRELI